MYLGVKIRCLFCEFLQISDVLGIGLRGFGGLLGSFRLTLITWWNFSLKCFLFTWRGIAVLALFPLPLFGGSRGCLTFTPANCAARSSILLPTPKGSVDLPCDMPLRVSQAFARHRESMTPHCVVRPLLGFHLFDVPRLLSNVV